MKKQFFFFLLTALFLPLSVLAQFGQNKVQYKNFTWYYIQTDHFDIYFSMPGVKLAEFTSKAAEDALTSIEKSFNYKINNRITIIVYNSTNDFQETNVTDSYLGEGIEGFTEIFKNRIVVQFMGSYSEFRHLIHHELTHAVMNDYFYGGSLQNIITNNISLNLPQWFNEGMAEYQSLGWDINTDMFIRDAIINDYLPDINELNGYVAYRGGESIFHYLSEKYGKEKIGELISKIKNSGDLEKGLKETTGINLKELNERWRENLKRIYWPDVSLYKSPDEFAKKLTDSDEGVGYYNTNPAISPQGDKIAFISNRDYYFDVYIMNVFDGKIIKKLVKGNRSADFEQLNVVAPGLCWSPDGNKVALSAKSEGNDVIYIIDVNTEDKIILPVKLDGIKSLCWSQDGNNLAFIGHNAVQSDLYIYDFNRKIFYNLTNDVFTDNDPTWAPDSKTIYFSSNRNNYISPFQISNSFQIYNYKNSFSDIYSINIDSKKIERITNMPNSNQISPVVEPSGKQILFISDLNGINNIYKQKIKVDTEKEVFSKAIPITNSLNGLYQLSLSKDGKKMIFSSLYKGSYNLFFINNPFEIRLDSNKLIATVFISSLEKKETMLNTVDSKIIGQIDTAQIIVSDSVTKFYSNVANVYGDSVQIDFSNYIFGGEAEKTNAKIDTTNNNKFPLQNNLDNNGNYFVNRYKIKFSPDIVYANAGYSTFFGLLGTTVLSFGDVLGDYRIVAQTSLQIDLRNSDYGLAYFSLKNRLNYGVEGFHIARFVYLNSPFGTNLFRFRNYGATFSLSFPLNQFYRFEAGLSWLNVSMEDLDVAFYPGQYASYIVPTLSFVHDNSLWGFTAPFNGTRYRFDIMANPGIEDKNLSFYSFLSDYRRYFGFWKYYTLAFRFSSGYSWGTNPQRFFLGGVDNWINRQFETINIPLNSPSDFAFLTAALPLRGHGYAAKIGTKYALINLEFRFPLIRYLVPGPLPILFSNIMGNAFFDAGTAWTRIKDLRLFERNINNNFITNDLLMGTGVGARLYFLYFLVRFDVAWAYYLNSFSKPKFYISLGTDF